MPRAGASGPARATREVERAGQAFGADQRPVGGGVGGDLDGMAGEGGGEGVAAAEIEAVGDPQRFGVGMGGEEA